MRLTRTSSTDMFDLKNGGHFSHLTFEQACEFGASVNEDFFKPKFEGGCVSFPYYCSSVRHTEQH